MVVAAAAKSERGRSRDGDLLIAERADERAELNATARRARRRARPRAKASTPYLGPIISMTVAEM